MWMIAGSIRNSSRAHGHVERDHTAQQSRRTSTTAVGQHGVVLADVALREKIDTARWAGVGSARKEVALAVGDQRQVARS